MADIKPLTTIGGGWQNIVWYLQDGKVRCWCCLGTGENQLGSECDACDGSSFMPDTPPCRPLCREPHRILKSD